MQQTVRVLGEAIPVTQHHHQLVAGLALATIVRLAERVPKGCSTRKALARCAKELEAELAV